MEVIGRDKCKKDTYMLKTLLNMFKRKQINKDNPLQREPDQWSMQRQGGLVASVIKGEDVDSIKLCEQLIGNLWIIWLIDGLQRLTTLEKYSNNAFPISKKQKMPYVYYQRIGENGEREVIEYDLRGKYYSDLPDELKDAFDSYPIDVVKQLNCTNEDVAYHMERYNQQENMNANQKGVLAMDKIACYIKDISKNHPFFKSCGSYKEIDVKKDSISRIVSDTIMAIFHLDNWRKSGIGEFLNENATEEEFDPFKQELDRLTTVIDADTTGKLFNVKNSFVWFAAFDRFTKWNLPDERFNDFLIEFKDHLHSTTFEEYENESFDTYDSARSTKDKKVVLAKLDIIERLMKEYFGIKSDPKTEDVVENITEEPVEKMEECAKEVVEETVENTVEDADKSQTVESENAELQFVKDNVSEETESDDLELYDSVLSETVADNSPLYKAGKSVLLALVAYSFKEDKDIEFEKWISGYNVGNFSPNPRTNFLYMKRDFDRYTEAINVA